MHRQINAKIIQHTRHNSTTLVSLEIEFPRFILAQINTHKRLSRNYQSSRAMPVLKQMQQISKDPFIPNHLGSAKRGMVAGEQLQGFRRFLAKSSIYLLSRVSLGFVWVMQKCGLSKEIANRYLEPWMITKGVVTATQDAWEAFFKLRAEHDAQPEIQYLANCIKNEIEMSAPFELRAGEWHVPYYSYHRDYNLDRLYYLTKIEYNVYPEYFTLKGLEDRKVEDVVKNSTAGVAQVSYRDIDLNKEKTDRVFKQLKFPEAGVYPDGEGNVHFSPAEHCAVAVDYGNEEYSGNFWSNDYYQYRKLLENGTEKVFMNNNTES